VTPRRATKPPPIGGGYCKPARRPRGPPPRPSPGSSQLHRLSHTRPGAPPADKPQSPYPNAGGKGPPPQASAGRATAPLPRRPPARGQLAPHELLAQSLGSKTATPPAPIKLRFTWAPGAWSCPPGPGPPPMPRPAQDLSTAGDSPGPWGPRRPPLRRTARYPAPSCPPKASAHPPTPPESVSPPHNPCPGLPGRSIRPPHHSEAPFAQGRPNGPVGGVPSGPGAGKPPPRPAPGARWWLGETCRGQAARDSAPREQGPKEQTAENHKASRARPNRDPRCPGGWLPDPAAAGPPGPAAKTT